MACKPATAAAVGRRYPRTAPGQASGEDDYLWRLRKIEDQVHGLQKMIEADTWCPDVVTQVASATRPLQEAAVGAAHAGLVKPISCRRWPGGARIPWAKVPCDAGISHYPWGVYLWTMAGGA